MDARGVISIAEVEPGALQPAKLCGSRPILRHASILMKNFRTPREARPDPAGKLVDRRRASPSNFGAHGLEITASTGEIQ